MTIRVDPGEVSPSILTGELIRAGARIDGTIITEGGMLYGTKAGERVDLPAAFVRPILARHRRPGRDAAKAALIEQIEAAQTPDDLKRALKAVVEAAVR